MAEKKEKQAVASSNKSETSQAQLEAAEARVELAQLELDRCTLRAPFTGQVTALPVSSGQYVQKGATIAELSDISSLKTLQPVDRRAITAGSSLPVQIEGRDVSAKVMAILPLPENFSKLRELATPLAAALLVVANPKGDLEPGLRAQHETVPNTPIATVPKRALKQEDARSGDSAMIQVIRNEYVTNVPVRVLGEMGADRVQIAGPLRASDSLIASSSVPLVPGTLVRFGEGATNRAIEGTSPNPALGGVEAGLTSPPGARGRVAPGGAGKQDTPPKRPTTRAPSASSTPF
jgi:multidrug efflux pump subunit AcrA (membrane-fusion protein)